MKKNLVEVTRDCPIVQLRGIKARVLGNLLANDTHERPGLWLEVIANKGKTIHHKPEKGFFGKERYRKNELIGFQFRLGAHQVKWITTED